MKKPLALLSGVLLLLLSGCASAPDVPKGPSVKSRMTGIEMYAEGNSIVLIRGAERGRIRSMRDDTFRFFLPERAPEAFAEATDSSGQISILRIRLPMPNRRLNTYRFQAVPVSGVRTGENASSGVVRKVIAVDPDGRMLTVEYAESPDGETLRGKYDIFRQRIQLLNGQKKRSASGKPGKEAAR